jgi:hypothetical protein
MAMLAKPINGPRMPQMVPNLDENMKFSGIASCDSVDFEVISSQPFCDLIRNRLLY